MIQGSYSWKGIQRKFKDTCNPVFTAPLFTTAKTEKQSKCPSTDKWIKPGYINTMEYYSAIKRMT